MKRRLWLATTGLVFVLTLVASVASTTTTHAASLDDSPDCDKFSVMMCGDSNNDGTGARQFANIQEKYNNGDGVNRASDIQGIFSKLGISARQVNTTGFITGVVHDDIEGTITVDGKIVAKSAKTYIRTVGVVAVGQMSSDQTAFVKLGSNGQFLYAIMKPCGNPVQAISTVAKPTTSPTPTQKPAQSLTCDMLDLSGLENNDRTVTAFVAGTAKNGAKITGYIIDFGDNTVINTSPSKNRVAHTYKSDGEYYVNAYVTGVVTENGTAVTKTVTDKKKCRKSVTIKAPEVAASSQTLFCVSLDIPPTTTRKITATVTGAALSEAKINNHSIDFGDGTISNLRADTHTYAKGGTYIVTGNVIGTVVENGKKTTKTATCVKPVIVT